MERDSFVLYTKVIEVVNKLDDVQKGKLFQAILDFESSGEYSIDDPIVDIAFTPIRQDLEVNNRKWEEQKESRSKAGKKGMQKRWGNNTDTEAVTNDNTVITDDNKNNTVITSDNKNNTAILEDNTAKQEITNITDNVYEYVNVNENVNVDVNVDVNEKKKEKGGDKSPQRFLPPTLEEVAAYCKERNNNINAQSFIDFYASKGWMVGKNKMKDWKACVRTWEQRSRENSQPKTSAYMQAIHDRVDIVDGWLERSGEGAG
jgi:hypothetical protein